MQFYPSRSSPLATVSKDAGGVGYIEPNRSGFAVRTARAVRGHSRFGQGDVRQRYVHDTDVHDELGGNSMSDLSVETEAVRAFATENAGIAAQISSAGFDGPAQVAALTPVFGLIGADYLLSFAAAQVLQAKDINDLSAKYADLSFKAFNAASLYEGTDTTNAGALNVQAGEIGGGA
ncbi:ESX-1 secretion-associated protein [Nocardia amikacinitolerans]|uniref:ESX-1 secretion-associated protein n=1 Tax=Nocardia amikacinitolerans TaxID=756689 RepID=UPI0027E29260|nr:ESX-1 secretion-associated protein [Nocardia amikacinitolerans]